LNRYNSIEGTVEGTQFFSKYNRIYGEGLPHEFNYITNVNDYGTEHYFSSEIFHLFNITVK
jgi:hypothetical protein